MDIEKLQYLDKKKVQSLLTLSLSKDGKQKAKDALHFYIQNEFGVEVPKNYGIERAVSVAEKRIKFNINLAEQEKYIEDEVPGGFIRKIVTPNDILNGDTSIIRYDQPKVYKEDPEIRILPYGHVEEKEEPTPALNTTLDTVSYQSKPEIELHFDKNFLTYLEFNLTAPNGQKCAQVGYWVIDEIINLGALWKLKAFSSRYRNELMSMVYHIQTDGEVVVVETRNNQYITFR